MDEIIKRLLEEDIPLDRRDEPSFIKGAHGPYSSDVFVKFLDLAAVGGREARLRGWASSPCYSGSGAPPPGGGHG